jgi:hypothetical protein
VEVAGVEVAEVEVAEVATFRGVLVITGQSSGECPPSSAARMPIVPFQVTGLMRTYRARTASRNLFFTTEFLSVLPTKRAPLSTGVHVVALLLTDTV